MAAASFPAPTPAASPDPTPATHPEPAPAKAKSQWPWLRYASALFAGFNAASVGNDG
jgi:hypothetical protein